MLYLKALAYIPYIVEILTLVSQRRSLAKDQLARQMSDVVFRAVDHASKGKASRAVDKPKLTGAVQQVVDVITDVL